MQQNTSVKSGANLFLTGQLPINKFAPLFTLVFCCIKGLFPAFLKVGQQFL